MADLVEPPIRTDVIRDLASLPNTRRLKAQVDEALVACADVIEALAAELATLRAERDKLVEALGVFAFLEMEKDEGPADTQYVWETIHSDRVQDWIDYDDIEAARTTLASLAPR